MRLRNCCKNHRARHSRETKTHAGVVLVQGLPMYVQICTNIT